MQIYCHFIPMCMTVAKANKVTSKRPKPFRGNARTTFLKRPRALVRAIDHLGNYTCLHRVQSDSVVEQVMYTAQVLHYTKSI